MARPRENSAIRRAVSADVGHRPIRGDGRVDPAPPPGVPDCPASLHGRERDIWFETIYLLRQIPGLLAQIDGSTIADFCRASNQLELIERGLKREMKRAVQKARLKNKGLKSAIAFAKANKQDAPDADFEDGEIDAAHIAMQYQGTLDKLRMRKNSLGRELGMTPSSRSQIKVMAPSYAGAETVRREDIIVTDPIFDAGTGGLMPV